MEYLQNKQVTAIIFLKRANKLKKYGIFMKGDKSKHHLVMFFDNSRYQSTLASTPSDQNACRQVYRQFRKYFF